MLPQPLIDKDARHDDAVPGRWSVRDRASIGPDAGNAHRQSVDALDGSSTTSMFMTPLSRRWPAPGKASEVPGPAPDGLRTVSRRMSDLPCWRRPLELRPAGRSGRAVCHRPQEPPGTPKHGGRPAAAGTMLAQPLIDESAARSIDPGVDEPVG